MLVQQRGGLHVKIVDLGIARIVSEHERRTQPSACIGTPIYMAPEVFATEHFPPEGYFAADLYAVGTILYELLVGTPPFRGAPARIIYQKVQAPAPDIRDQGVLDLPEELATIIMRCLERDAQRRFTSIDTLGAALRSVPFGPRGSPSSAPRRGRALRPSQAQPQAKTQVQAKTQAQEEGAEVSVSLASERRIGLDLPSKGRAIVYIRHVRARQRGPHPLALSQVCGLLPAALIGTHNGETLSVRAVSTEARAHLYRDASQPGTRLEQLLLGRASTSLVFDVGHRRHRVRRIRATMLDASTGAHLHPVGGEGSIRLTSPPWPGCIFILETLDDDTTQHIECICLEPHQ